MVFSVVNTIRVLPPLPFKDPQRLAWLAGGNGAGGRSVVTYRADAYEAFRDHNRSFEKVTGFCPFYSYSSFQTDRPWRPTARRRCVGVGEIFFTLGVQPILGRDFTAERGCTGQTAGDVELRILADPISRRSIPRWQNDWIGWRTGDGRRRRPLRALTSGLSSRRG